MTMCSINDNNINSPLNKSLGTSKTIISHSDGGANNQTNILNHFYMRYLIGD